jgi:hypothetical protein
MPSPRTSRKVAAKPKTDMSERAQQPPAAVPAVEEIRIRAYKIYVDRGGSDGQDLEDWLQAEKELVEHVR